MADFNSYVWKSKDGKIYLQRCPECHLENYACSVAEGICAWCGYDANKNNKEKNNG